jgi:predicted MFS family arabinose efflux permease
MRVISTTLWRGLRWWASQRQLGRQFWIFVAASFCFDLGLSIYLLLFNLFLVGHGFTEKALGFLTSAMAAGSIAGAIPAGKLAKTFGLQKALMTFFIFGTAIFVMRSLTLSYTGQLVLAFLSGMALSTFGVCLSPTVAQLTSERTRPFAFSLVFSVGIVIPSLGGLAGGLLPGWLAKSSLPIHSLEPIQVVLLASCGILAMGIWPVLNLKIGRAPVRTKTRRTFNPFLVRFLLAIALWSMVDDSFSPFANVYFARYLQMSLPQIGLTFSLSQLAQVLAVLASPLVFRKFGLVAGITYLQIATALTLGSLAMTHGATTGALIYVAYTAFQCSEPGMYTLLMNRVPPEERDSASALNSFVMSCSQAIAAAFAGASIARLGYPFVLWVTSGLSLAAAGSFWGLLRSPRSAAAFEGEPAPAACE